MLSCVSVPAQPVLHGVEQESPCRRPLQHVGCVGHYDVFVAGVNQSLRCTITVRPTFGPQLAGGLVTVPHSCT